MSGKLARPLVAAQALWLSVIITLYLAPSEAKYFSGDVLAAVLLVSWLTVIGLRRSGIVSTIKPLAPLLILVAFVWLVDNFVGQASSAYYIRELLIGFVPFLLLYVIFRNQQRARANLYAAVILVIPGLIHLAYLYFDIFLAIQNGNILFASSSRDGILEHIKEAPRVGRRYVSMAMVHLLCGGLLLVASYRRSYVRKWALGLSALGVLSLALLDARAAYVSLLIGGLFLISSIGIGPAGRALNSILIGGQWRKLGLIGALALTIALGYNAGKSRWLSMAYSFEMASHDVFDSKVSLKDRPYVDKDFWNAPIDDVAKCYQEERFRCKVDQSAYLRMAWLLEGFRSIKDHPLGTGYAVDYMGRLWGVAGDDSKYQRSDNFLVEQMVSFGVEGVLLYAVLCWSVGHTLRLAVRKKHSASITLVAVGGIIFVCVGRSLIDVFSEGLWRYFMALLGMYYGLLHSDALPQKRMV